MGTVAQVQGGQWPWWDAEDWPPYRVGVQLRDGGGDSQGFAHVLERRSGVAEETGSLTEALGEKCCREV